MSERSTEISFYPLEDRRQIARGLLENLTTATDWRWNLKYHPDPEGDSMDHIGIAYWTITAASRVRKLQMTMVLGRTPWTMVNNFWFKQDKANYQCREDSFIEVSAFMDLGEKLETKAREIKDEQDQEIQRQQERAQEAREIRRQQRVKSLLSGLHNSR